MTGNLHILQAIFKRHSSCTHFTKTQATNVCRNTKTEKNRKFEGYGHLWMCNTAPQVTDLVGWSNKVREWHYGITNAGTELISHISQTVSEATTLVYDTFWDELNLPPLLIATWPPAHQDQKHVNVYFKSASSGRQNSWTVTSGWCRQAQLEGTGICCGLAAKLQRTWHHICIYRQRYHHAYIYWQQCIAGGPTYSLV